MCLPACLQMLGDRAEAVIAFRSAHRLVSAAAGVPEVPEAIVAARNLSRAIKQGFALRTNRLRPSTAPPMYRQVGSTAVPHGEKLTTFLRAAVLLPNPPVPAPLPHWAVRVTPADKEAQAKAKEAAKKEKEKASKQAKDGKVSAARPGGCGQCRRADHACACVCAYERVEPLMLVVPSLARRVAKLCVWRCYLHKA